MRMEGRGRKEGKGKEGDKICDRDGEEGLGDADRVGGSISIRPTLVHIWKNTTNRLWRFVAGVCEGFVGGDKVSYLGAAAASLPRSVSVLLGVLLKAARAKC